MSGSMFSTSSQSDSPVVSSRLVVVLDVGIGGRVVGEPSEEQVGEQVGAALLVGAWILGAEACGPWRRACRRWRRRRRRRLHR